MNHYEILAEASGGALTAKEVENLERFGVKDSAELKAVMFKSMLNQYNLLVSRYGYEKADKKMTILFNEEWENMQEEIWQEHDLIFLRSNSEH